MSGVGETVQNPHLFIRPIIRREALLSSRIEGTVCSLSDVFSFEASHGRDPSDDVREVINYVSAMELGIKLLKDLPISLRFVNEVHKELMTGVRGQANRPGYLRLEQVWLGSPSTSIGEARFVPPPPDRLRDLFADWEKFANEPLDMPPLVKCALMHYQIEAIHPYEDGNGRIGRLMIVLFLIASGMLSVPLLYLSAYFERDRQRYYDELLNVSATGDWERWLRYFLTGVLQQSEDVLARMRGLRDIQEGHRRTIQGGRGSSSALRLLDEFFANPFMTVRGASLVLDMSLAGARRVLNRLVEAGLLRVDDSAWPPLYVADDVLKALRGTNSGSDL
ncbi:MAG: Fic family protein [Dehalococcoidia bacterium]|nr:Fic family protein [Dehalococcoidia bacterium]